LDEWWRESVVARLLAAHQAGEFRTVDAEDFAIGLSALLDGMAVQIGLEDAVVTPVRAFELSMRYVADTLGFQWTPGRGRREVTQAADAT
jgi:hypothetical protein